MPIENIQARLNDNKFAAGVFADLKKAFETEIARKQFVSVNNHNCKIQANVKGVP